MDLTQHLIDMIRNQLDVPILTLGTSVVTLWTLVYLVCLTTLVWFLAKGVRAWLVRRLIKRYGIRARISAGIGTVVRYTILAIGIVEILDFSELDVTAVQILDGTNKLLTTPLLPIGDTRITLWTLVYIIGLGIMLVVITGQLQKWLVLRVFRTASVEIGVKQATGTIIRYALIALGFIVLLQTAGIDLSTLTVMAGALGLGIGFGLQNIAANMVAGLFVLFERPVKIGDRIQVGEVLGDIMHISLRAATVRTNDNIEIVVPNSDFIDKQVINWSLSNKRVRLPIPVGVSYGSDPEHVRKVLLEVADDHKGLLKKPRPDVMFIAFGNSSLDFELRVWTKDYATIPVILKSELYFEIFKRFKQEGIEIPFPQRDLHIKSGILHTSSEN